MDDPLKTKSPVGPPRPTVLTEGRSKRPGVASDDSLTSPSASPWRSESVSISTEYHLTVRTKVELSRREASLLLDVLNYQVAHFGTNFVQHFAMTDLYFRVLGKARLARDIKDEHIRLTLTVTETILRDINRQMKSELGLEGTYRISEVLVRRLSSVGALMSQRTYRSRYVHWRPEAILIVRSVPVDIQMLERDTSSEPYSGYCKGYGESHPSAHRVRTRPSFELDGDETPLEQLKEKHLFHVCTQVSHVIANALEIWYEIESAES